MPPSTGDETWLARAASPWGSWRRWSPATRSRRPPPPGRRRSWARPTRSGSPSIPGAGCGRWTSGGWIGSRCAARGPSLDRTWPLWTPTPTGGRVGVTRTGPLTDLAWDAASRRFLAVTDRHGVYVLDSTMSRVFHYVVLDPGFS